MWPFGKEFNSILVTDDETGIVKQYLYKFDNIETYAGNMQDCIMIYRKDNHNVYVESIVFEKEFKQIARNSPTSKVAGCKGFGLVQGLAPCA